MTDGLGLRVTRGVERGVVVQYRVPYPHPREPSGKALIVAGDGSPQSMSEGLARYVVLLRDAGVCSGSTM